MIFLFWNSFLSIILYRNIDYLIIEKRKLSKIWIFVFGGFLETEFDITFPYYMVLPPLIFFVSFSLFVNN